jgi:predicted transcriptional regulator
MMNRGAQELQKRLNGLQRGAQERLARELDTSSGVISHWLTGKRKPSARFRGILNAMHGISWTAWDEDVGEVCNG